MEKVKTIPFGLSTNSNLTLQYVKLNPSVDKTALSVNGATAEIDVENSIINVNGGTKNTRGDGIIISSAASVTFKNNTFNNVTSGHYVRAMFISNVSGNVDIDTNTATGFHVFAAMHSVSTGVEGKVVVTTVQNNTSTGMTGDFQIKSGETVTETKDSKFLQIAGAGSNVVVKDNTVSAKAGVDAVPYVNIHDSTVSVASLTVDKDLKVTGELTITGTVQVEGQITLATLTGSEVTTTSVAINNNAMLVANGGLVGDKNATIANAGTFVNNGVITCSDKGQKVTYNGTGTFVAGAGSTATFNTSVSSDDQKKLFVGTGTVNDKKNETTKAEVASGTPITVINKYLEEELDVTGVNTTLGDKDVITVVPGSSISGTVTNGDSSVKFDGVKGEFTVKKGSISIYSSKIEGTIEVVEGTFKITGKITGDLTIDAKGKNVEFSDVTVNSGVKLTLKNSVPATGGFSVAAGKAFNLYGSIANGNTVAAPATPALINVIVPEGATFKAYSGSQIAGTILVTGPTGAEAGTIDLTQAQNPQSVGEDISYDKTYGQLENVTVVGSLTIKNNSTVTVKGGFQVNEGVTVTIEKGSKLVIDSLAASMIVDGRIVVEEDGELNVIAAKDVKVSGSIDSDGTVVIDSKVTIKSGGAITINDGTVEKATAAANVAAVKALYKSTFEPKKGLVVEAGATLTVKSLMYSAAAMNIDNKGTVVFDKAIIGGADVNVNMLADSAVVQVISIENIATGITNGKATAWDSRNLVITDNGLVFADKKVVGSTDATKFGGKANEVTITVGGNVVKGLTVVETVSSVTKNGTTTYYNTLDLAGAVSVAKIEDASTGTLSFSAKGDRIAVTGELTLGKDVIFEVTAGAKISVSGKLIATEERSEITHAGDEANFTVTGLVQVLSTKPIQKISAAMYESKVGTTAIYNYTTLKAAIDSGAKDITVSGTVYVTESVTVPAGVTIKNNGEIVVGSADDTEVVLTVADTASIKYGKVTVYGTLYFENKKDNKAAEIESDVSVTGEKDARYTNLFTALNNANAGETVTVTGEKVLLKKNITIKEGVTLDVPNSKKLVVSAGVTITVNGTLKTAEKIETAKYTTTAGVEEYVTFALAADKLNGKAAIIVNGVFMSMAAVDYNTDAKYMIPGAYYSLIDDAGAYNYVTTLENASKAAATPVTVYGKVSAGDVVFTGTDSAPRSVVVADDADLTVASITLDKTTFTVNATGKFTGDVKAGDAAVSVKLVNGMVVSVDKNGLFTVEGATAADAKSSSFKVSAGSVYIETASMNVTVTAGATLVSAAAQSTITGKLTIEGTVTVANEQTITVKGDVTVKGALSVADATDSKIAGTFNAEKNLYIGLTSKDVTSDAASVSGAVYKVQVAFVKTDANVSDATIESFKVDGVLKSTTYVVEGKDWMTVYDRTGNYLIKNVTEAPFENAEFKDEKWLNTDGKSADNSLIGTSKCDKVTANINYEIYRILVNPAAGIESIAVDGNLMIKDSETGMYGMVVKAGTHEITCKLANGYSGEAKFAIVDSLSTDGMDATLNGNKVTVSGDAGVVGVQITGVEKSGYVDPTPVVPEEKDDGMSLTDILLIVLVVLIVIMAVIVAMRLMRS